MTHASRLLLHEVRLMGRRAAAWGHVSRHEVGLQGPEGETEPQPGRQKCREPPEERQLPPEPLAAISRLFKTHV